MAIKGGIKKNGLLYRWVDYKKALSNIKTDSLYPGKWQHNIPGFGIFSGISFGYNPRTWHSYDNGICFVVDRNRLNYKKIIDIPAQEIYNYSNATLNPLGDYGSVDLYLKNIRDATENTEAFYVGIIRPLNDKLTKIIMGDVSKKLKEATLSYAKTFDILVEDLNGTQIYESEISRIKFLSGISGII